VPAAARGLAVRRAPGCPASDLPPASLLRLQLEVLFGDRRAPIPSARAEARARGPRAVGVGERERCAGGAELDRPRQICEH
jgi:hypothetical protein